MNNILTDEYIREKSPAIFSNIPSQNVSDKYSFVSTKNVIELLKKENWHVVNVKQKGTISKYRDKLNYQKHVVRFRHIKDLEKNITNNDYIKEIVMTNSHDRTSCFVFHMGIFRQVCSNGLVVADTNLAKIKITHKGFEEKEIEIIIKKVMKNFEFIPEQIKAMKGKLLNNNQKLMLAKKALQLRWKEKCPIAPENLLRVRRKEDEERNLWITMNIIQENIMKGGYFGRKIRAIKNIDREIYINKKLWEIATQYLS